MHEIAGHEGRLWVPRINWRTLCVLKNPSNEGAQHGDFGACPPIRRVTRTHILSDIGLLQLSLTILKWNTAVQYSSAYYEIKIPIFIRYHINFSNTIIYGFSSSGLQTDFWRIFITHYHLTGPPCKLDIDRRTSSKSSHVQSFFDQPSTVRETDRRRERDREIQPEHKHSVERVAYENDTVCNMWLIKHHGGSAGGSLTA